MNALDGMERFLTAEDRDWLEDHGWELPAPPKLPESTPPPPFEDGRLAIEQRRAALAAQGWELM